MNIEYSATSVEATRAGRNVLWRVLLGTAVMFLVLQGGLMLLIPSLDQPAAALVVAAAMFVAMLVSIILTVAMVAFFPIYSVVTGMPIRMKADWLWVLIGAIALNGLAEEALFRGYVFGHLRQGGHSFWRAGFTSLVIFSLVHLFLLVEKSPGDCSSGHAGRGGCRVPVRVPL